MFWSKKNKMDKILTKDMLAAMIPGNDKVDMWFEAIEEIFPKYEINTVERIAGFIAQCAHESNNFRSLEENLNYSEDALLRVFGRYFGKAPKASASEYARNPEMIANRVYNDEFRKYKMGNTQPGDGWMFRGRGLKQLTGRENYTKFGKSVKMSAEQAAEYVATEKGAIESACWFWNNKKLNAIADTGNIKKIEFGDEKGGLTAKINDRDAAKNFASRHNCDTKTDKMSAGYWACRLPKYAEGLGLKGGGSYFW